MGAYLIFAVNGISATDASSSAWRAIVTPTSSLLSIGTIAGHVASVATDATNDVGREVLLFRAIVLAVTNLATVLASLVLIIT